MYLDREVMPTPEDIRGARAYLGMSQGMLGDLCALSAKAIANIENKKFQPTKRNLLKIQTVFSSAGLEFLAGGGFRPRQELVKIYQGYDGVKAFFEDVYHTAKRKAVSFLLVAAIIVNLLMLFKKLNLIIQLKCGSSLVLNIGSCGVIKFL